MCDGADSSCKEEHYILHTNTYYIHLPILCFILYYAHQYIHTLLGNIFDVSHSRAAHALTNGPFW